MFNLKKAIIAGIINFALMFLAASILMFTPGFSEMGTLFNTGMVVVVAIITFAVSKYYYFKEMAIVNSLKEGLMLGVIMAGISFIVEVPVMVYGFVADQGWSYFMTWHAVLGYLLMIMIPVVVAKMK